MPAKSSTRIVKCELCKNDFAKISPSHNLYEPTCKCYSDNSINVCPDCSKNEPILCNKCNKKIEISTLLF